MIRVADVPAPAAALYLGEVMHRRLRPRRHRLAYRIYSLLIDVDRVGMPGLRLFSHNRLNLFSLYDRDYGHPRGDAAGGSLRARAERQLAAAGIAPDGGWGAIRLLTMPRVLGFAFNPVSLWFCHGREGGLRAIIYEVNNTFGERHSYVAPVDAPGVAHQAAGKAFHVSPFMGLAMGYRFRVAPPGERLAIAITGSDAAGPLIVAVHTARRVALTDGALLRAFFTHPLVTLKVVAAIGWEAARLWRKGVPVHRHPAPPATAVTIGTIETEAAWI